MERGRQTGRGIAPSESDTEKVLEGDGAAGTSSTGGVQACSPASEQLAAPRQGGHRADTVIHLVPPACCVALLISTLLAPLCEMEW